MQLKESMHLTNNKLPLHSYDTENNDVSCLQYSRNTNGMYTKNFVKNLPYILIQQHKISKQKKVL